MATWADPTSTWADPSATWSSASAPTGYTPFLFRDSRGNTTTGPTDPLERVRVQT